MGILDTTMCNKSDTRLRREFIGAPKRGFLGDRK
jgi:hypothetical protein